MDSGRFHCTTHVQQTRLAFHPERHGMERLPASLPCHGPSRVARMAMAIFLILEAICLLVSTGI